MGPFWTIFSTYLLTVFAASPNGVKSFDGVPLDGSGQGEPGSDYVARIQGVHEQAPKAMPTVVGRPVVTRAWSPRFGGFRRPGA